jgi:protein O-mannosyl-transferase
MTLLSLHRHRADFLVIILMLLTVVVYWPSLYGGYLFDDATSFVTNPDVHIKTLSAQELWLAAISQCSTNLLCRPLSALTFALNYYFSGLDPFWPKFTNLGIHLLNGLLLFFVVRSLFQFCSVRKDAALAVTAAAVAGLWLLLPINLTSVAYVSQRVEELSNLFVFLGLILYMRFRRRVEENNGGGFQLIFSLLACTAAGLTAKEDAALLPLYTACFEFAILRFRNRNGSISKLVTWTHFYLLIVPMVAGLIWIAPRVLHGVSDYRNFTIIERVLTESRVLVDYVLWTLLPNLNTLTFYHDDLTVSKSLIDPPTTIAAIFFLATLFSVALWQRPKRPTFCLGILWFFAGHSMTATVIPLELVFEHRNYFPSVGLLLSAASLIANPPFARFSIARITCVAAFTIFFASTTFLRSQEWSDPITLAYSEALKRPQSQRAQYELARTLILTAGDDKNSPLIDESIKILEQSAIQADSGITSLQALIFIRGRSHQQIDQRWWKAIVEKLNDRAPTQSDIAAIIFLFHCQLDRVCPQQRQELIDTFIAALERSRGNVNLISAYADFALRELHDVELAESLSREAVAAKPAIPVFRANLIRILISTQQFDKADLELTELQARNQFGSLDSTIADLKNLLAASRSAAR